MSGGANIVNSLGGWTHDDDERFEEAEDLLRDGVAQPAERSSADARHLDVEDREDGAEDTADDADQQRRREHDHVHRDSAAQLQ